MSIVAVIIAIVIIAIVVVIVVIVSLRHHDLLVTMSVLDEMCQGDERGVERLARSDAAILVDRQHPLQNVDEFPTIRLLAQQF